MRHGKAACMVLAHGLMIVMVNGSNVPIRRESMSKARKRLKEHLFSQTRGGAV